MRLKTLVPCPWPELATHLLVSTAALTVARYGYERVWDPGNREYETMVFASDSSGSSVDYHDRFCRRYMHALDASVGHWDIVRCISESDIRVMLADSENWRLLWPQEEDA